MPVQHPARIGEEAGQVGGRWQAVFGQRQQGCASGQAAALAGIAFAEQAQRPFLRVQPVARSRVDRLAIGGAGPIEAETQRVKQITFETA